MKKVAALLLCLLVSSACREDLKWSAADKRQGPTPSPAASPVAANNPEATPLPTAATTPSPIRPAYGQFKIVYTDMQTQSQTDLAKMLLSHQFPRYQLGILNSTFVIPEEITVKVTECKAADGSDILNAFYLKETREVRLCIGFFRSIAMIFYDGKDYVKAIDEAHRVFQFMLFHEMGHALIDVLKLPITGREEDAADQFAIWALAHDFFWDEGKSPQAIYAAHYFNRSAGTRNETYADQHGFSQQRVYNFSCWVYGTAPEKYSYLINDGYLTYARAATCREEWLQLKAGWVRLLTPHFRGPQQN
jgi:hypothetical protein